MNQIANSENPLTQDIFSAKRQAATRDTWGICFAKSRDTWEFLL
jgi:hypothetical protein